MARPKEVVSLRKEKTPEPAIDGRTFHHGGSFAAYMQLKNSKLQEQFLEQAKTTAATTGADSLLAGVRIHVNGLTKPSHAVRTACGVRHA